MTNKEFLGRYIAEASGEEAFDTMYTYAVGCKVATTTDEEYREKMSRWLESKCHLFKDKEGE